LYCLCVVFILALMAYAIYCSWAFWDGLWHGSYISFFSPFMLNTSVAIALGLGAIPMVILCTIVYKLNNISNGRFVYVKSFIIWLPACVCIFSLLILFHEFITSLAFRYFF
jgi:hypothetical protein